MGGYLDVGFELTFKGFSLIIKSCIKDYSLVSAEEFTWQRKLHFQR